MSSVLEERTVRITAIPDPAIRRHRALWYTVGWLIAGCYVGVGVGYSAGHYSPNVEKSFILISNIEGSVRTHGIILVALSMFLCFGLGHYSKLTWLALVASTFYSLVTALLIFLGWSIGPVYWGTPWMYLLTGALSITLMVYAPPVSTLVLERRRTE